MPPSTRAPTRATTSKRGGSSVPTSKLVATESAERGRAAREAVPRSAHGDWAPAAEPAGSGLCAAVAGDDTPTGARPDPLRPDARLAVHVLSRRGRGDGGRSRGHAGLWDRRAGVRRRAHLELRRVRGSGPPADLRAERLRRDASGSVGVGCQADGGQCRDRRVATSGSRPIVGGRSCSPASREYREAMRGFAEMSHLDVWYERINASELVGSVRRQARKARVGSCSRSHSPRRGARPACARSSG